MDQIPSNGENLVWRKSTESGTGDCVEVAITAAGEVFVRHSRTPNGPVLVFNNQEWRAFLAGVRLGEFSV